MTKEERHPAVDKAPHSSAKKGISRAKDLAAGGGGKSLIIRVLLIAAVVAVGGYLLYYKAVQGDAVLILSDREIGPEIDIESVRVYKAQDKVYFHLHRKHASIDSGTVTFIIKREQGGKLVNYKKVQFEVEKDFPALDSALPGVYFRKTGKYQLEIQFDGSTAAKSDFEVK